MTGRRPVRVLHVIGSLGVGGVETWLMTALRALDRREIAMDFLVHSNASAAYDDEARHLGAQIIVCPRTRNPLAYARALGWVLKAHGPYDVVHSHVAYFSGVSLMAAALNGVPIRIAHSHTDRRLIEASGGRLRGLYVRVMRQLVWRNATVKLANSVQSGISLFGERWSKEASLHVLPYGVALGPYRAVVQDDRERRRQLRVSLGLENDEFVVGHIGRFVEVKNHRFIVDIMRRVVTIVPKARLFLVGDGPLRTDIEAMVMEAGLAPHTVFAGLRSDVPVLLRDVIDVLVLPSHYEGLGLVLVEATASGTPAVISDVVPPEVDIVPGLIRRLSLAESAGTWAESIIGAREVSVSPREALEAVQASPFELAGAVQALTSYYRLPVVSSDGRQVDRMSAP